MPSLFPAKPVVTRGPAAGVVSLLVAAVLTVAPGCDRDEQVRSYRVPKEMPPPAMPASHAGHDHGPQQRMLTAILPQPGGDRTWFFKLQGPVEVVTAQKDDFDAFVRTVRFGASGDPQWIAPASCKELPGSEMRFAT